MISPNELRTLSAHIRLHDAPVMDKIPGALEAAAETIAKLSRAIEELGGNVEPFLGEST